MIKPIIATIGIATIIGGSLVGYGVTNAQNNQNNQVRTCQVFEGNVEAIYKPTGEIRKIQGNKVYLLNGDIVEAFEVSNADDFKKGQWVRIIDGKLEKLEEKCISSRFTTMGESIKVATGKIKSSTKEQVTIVTDKGEQTFTYFTEEPLKVGRNVIVDYVARDGKKVVIKISEDYFVNKNLEGEIIKIKGNKVDLLSGDIIKTYEVSNAGDFKEGQNVEIKDGKLEEISKDNSGVKFNTLGELITEIKGTVKSSTKEQVVLTTKDGDLTLTYFTDEPLKVKSEVTVGYVVRENEKIVVNISK
ncbi:hypothetical protein PV797_01570 [Clostridiaceae bacterium M8S5]|nr:hypothetical protein PV797_01570 [Clostridiaceae bacterium M8S5]